MSEIGLPRWVVRLLFVATGVSIACGYAWPNGFTGNLLAEASGIFGGALIAIYLVERWAKRAAYREHELIHRVSKGIVYRFSAEIVYAIVDYFFPNAEPEEPGECPHRVEVEPLATSYWREALYGPSDESRGVLAKLGKRLKDLDFSKYDEALAQRPFKDLQASILSRLDLIIEALSRRIGPTSATAWIVEPMTELIYARSYFQDALSDFSKIPDPRRGYGVLAGFCERDPRYHADHTRAYPLVTAVFLVNVLEILYAAEHAVIARTYPDEPGTPTDWQWRWHLLKLKLSGFYSSRAGRQA